MSLITLSYAKIINWLSDVLQEYGIRLNVVNEYGTSKQCSICDTEHENGRVKRGLYICELTGIKINADLNAARNIAKKVGYKTPTPKKILSFIVTTNGVKPITPKEGGNGRDLHGRNPALKGRGGGHWVTHLLRQRGYNCTAERLYVDLDGVHEIDIYCNAGTITVVGEAKVRVGSEVVKDVYYRAQEVRRRYPDKVSGRLVPAIYTMVADPSAVDKARELGVWIVENNKEKVALEEVLRTGQGG
jgi:Transposase and inactivated derivatives